MIEYEHVTARYRGGPEPVVRDVSFRAAAGAVTAVVGPNGSGKSTLVRALLGRIAMTGTIRVNGDTIGALAGAALARRVAVVPQREDPIFPMRLRDYVALGRYPHLGPWRSPGPVDSRAIQVAMDRAGVRDLAERPTDQLSGGEWQRARIARALAQDTPAVILDEPTTFLDIGHEMELFELLAALAQDGRVVLIASHELSLVARFADHAILVNRGAVVAAGAVAEVIRAATLEQAYGWPMQVARDPTTGITTVLPIRKPTS